METDFKGLVDVFVRLRGRKNELDTELSTVNKQIDEVEEKLMLCMEDLHLEKFSIPGVGTVYPTERFYAKTPKTPEAKEAFWNYLKSTGEFHSLITVNANTMNAWYKEKMAAASERGEVLEVPGITEVGVSKGLTLRKG